ncbi:hypothetical protein BIFGAL_04385 [Bifidobacterium gallicum DSM 20093 = LMG 11596]|uniref:Uncharacterized protein n=1 Tax=Bifidobacterium gallicum DSM 20093 = LMG 11596 TaxID=561180 RepID=D1NWX8_9BIFI|nr:hypothetical protein BIFGAL_04385 [Bifidobacterium gallicum DSM 20093 = LMG 11596]
MQSAAYITHSPTVPSRHNQKNPRMRHENTHARVHTGQLVN